MMDFRAVAVRGVQVLVAFQRLIIAVGAASFKIEVQKWCILLFVQQGAPELVAERVKKKASPEFKSVLGPCSLKP